MSEGTKRTEIKSSKKKEGREYLWTVNRGCNELNQLNITQMLEPRPNNKSREEYNSQVIRTGVQGGT